MKRYLKILGKFIAINLATMFAYRANLYNSLIITTGWGIVSIASITFLTSRTSHVYGWNRQELFLLTGVYSIATGIFHMFFSSSFERFSRVISTGELDGYLVKPIDVQFFLSTRNFRPITFIRVIIGVVFTWYILQGMHAIVSLEQLLFFSFFIFCSVFLMYGIWFLVIVLTVWYPTLTNLVDFLYQINNLGRYPPALLIYTKNAVVFLLIPLTLVASVPSRFILGKVTLFELLGLFLATGGFLIISRLFWLYALRHYSSASS